MFLIAQKHHKTLWSHEGVARGSQTVFARVFKQFLTLKSIKMSSEILKLFSKLSILLVVFLCRNQFALGNDSNSDGLQVANMLMVEWDEGLEFTAHCNLKNCPAEMEHDKCHITEQFSTSGQNLAWSWSSATLDCVEDASKRVQAW